MISILAVSDGVWYAAIALGTVLANILGLYVKDLIDKNRASQSAKQSSEERVTVAQRQEDKLQAVANTVQQVQQATDGLTQKLVDSKLAQGTAEGTATGLQQGRDETKETEKAKDEIVRDPSGKTIATIQDRRVGDK